MFRHFAGRLRRVRNFSYPRGKLDPHACGNLNRYGHFVSGRDGSAHVSANQHRWADRHAHCRAH